MEHLIKRQGSHLPHTLYLVVIMVVMGLASRMKNWSNALTPQFSPLDAQIMLYYIALLFFWYRLLQLHFSKSK
jgi:hypothetical protein